MTTRPVPTLSSKGWLKTAESRLDKVLEYYVSSNPSQTLIFKGHVFSLQSALRDCANDMDILVDLVRSGLETIFTRYFPEGARVEVSYTDIPDTALVSLHIGAKVIDKGTTFDLLRAIEGVDSSFMNTQKPHVVNRR